MAENLDRFGNSIDDGPGRRMTPEQQAEWRDKFARIAEKIEDAPNETERKFYTYYVLERICDYSDDWTARTLREDIALHVASGSDELKDLRGEPTGDVNKTEKQKGLEKSLELIQDVDKLFDQWWANYRYLSASAGGIFKTAFNNILEFMPPSFFARVYGEMPGFIEGDREWPSMSEQVDKSIRAYVYLALQADKRLAGELKWFKEGVGFYGTGKGRLFANEASEQKWLRELKLKTLPNEFDSVAYLRNKKYEELTNVDWARIDALPAFNIFSDAANGGSITKTREAIRALVGEGKYSTRPAMGMQSRIAEGFGRQTMYLFGIADMYGTRAKYNEKGEYEETVAEGYPWADAGEDFMNPLDKTAYNKKNSYYEGPAAWRWFAPKHLMLDFVKVLAVRDSEYPQAKGLTRSGWELFRSGKTFGEIFADGDHITDWAYRAYFIRFLFGYKEDSGVMLVMSGDLTQGRLMSNVDNGKFLEDAEKAIHIVCRDWIVTEGKYEEWFKIHDQEVVSRVNKIKTGDKLTPAEAKMRTIQDDKELRRKTQDLILKEYVRREKNRWKAIAWLSAVEQKAGIPNELQVSIEVAEAMGFLDKKTLEATKLVRFNDKNSVGNFIKLAEQSE